MHSSNNVTHNRLAAPKTHPLPIATKRCERDINVSDLETFGLVADTGSISGAAKRLSVPKSTVSRRTRRLEDALGHELLRRSARSVVLTKHGKVLHERTAGSLRQLQDAARAIGQANDEPAGTFRLSTVPGLGYSQRFIACLRDYSLRYPKPSPMLSSPPGCCNGSKKVLISKCACTQASFRERSTSCLGGYFRWGAFYASPGYIKEMGTPNTLDELSQHRLAAHSIVEVRNLAWTRNGAALKFQQSLPKPRWLVNDSAALERFALSGAGLALLMTLEGDVWAERGELVRMLRDTQQREAFASLVWPASRHLAPRVRAFIAHAVAAFAAP